MTGTTCCVPGCHNNTKYDRNVSWHVFPQKQTLREAWINEIRKKRFFENWEPKSYSKICGIHFNLGGRKTRYDRHPKFFMPKSPKKLEGNRIESIKRVREDVSLDSLNIGAEFTVGGNFTEVATVPSTERARKRQIHDGDHTYCLKYEISGKVAELERKVQKMSRIIKTQETTINILTLRVQAAELSAFDMKTKARECECASEPRLSVEEILQSDEALEFFTGFKRRFFFTKFSNSIKPEYKQIRNTTVSGGRPRSLSYSEELFIVYSKLKLNLLEDVIASIFSVSTATVSNVWSCWIQLLYSHLTKAPTWPSEQTPKQIIIDCVELCTETPSDETTKANTYSPRKGLHIVKGLVGITPNGVVAFVSDLYGGGKSERTIFEDCGILDFLAENDEVMADGGFVIGDLLDSRNVNYTCVDTSAGDEYPQMRQLVALRNRVEIVVDRIRDFGILKSSFPNTMRCKLNKIWKVCCLSLNFLSDPVFDDPLL